MNNIFERDGWFKMELLKVTKLKYYKICYYTNMPCRSQFHKILFIYCKI